MGKQSEITDQGKKLSWQRILLGILFIAFVWLIVSRINQVQKLAQTLEQGQWQWVLAAALLQVIYYLAFVGSILYVGHPSKTIRTGASDIRIALC
jgi:hypothetical protein